MRTSYFLLALLLVGSQVLAQEQDDAPAPGSEQSEASPAVDEEKADTNDAAPKPAGEFQPSEEIMADTMLTLPADI